MLPPQRVRSNFHIGRTYKGDGCSYVVSMSTSTHQEMSSFLDIIGIECIDLTGSLRVGNLTMTTHSLDLETARMIARYAITIGVTNG